MLVSRERNSWRRIRNELNRIDEEIEKQRQIVVSVSQEVKKLENLKEKQLEEYRHAEAKEEQDDI